MQSAYDTIAGCGEGLKIVEQVRMLEAATAALGQEVELANKYKVYAKDGREQLFLAEESTGCCQRQMKQCCGDCAPWSVKIKHTKGRRDEEVLRMERPFTMTCCCFNRPIVTVRDMDDNVIGSIRDPWHLCDNDFTIRDAQGEPRITANGGCCQWGLCLPLPCGPCSVVDFPLKDTSGTLVGNITKKVPGICKWCFASDVDNYHVDFPALKAPADRLLTMALAIFIDFRMFNNNRSDENDNIDGGAE
mmetsp:Transcript_76420/g.181780  ORF Transcript_76420/g.181780 Transcript_76420/m.181780 type:complete len:247 (+) Transcript_76420:173-913(+)|eukprot:CAMPEP_0178420722 /NCGR_PEP_ID=MMETSP0689_2-20121128/26278_1 /TAXON_ID=160604 /ORGANISM="Amphidinium massartii, Strain CS-259" /LENGTH=246 /DNA_ID=CAMNT_0020042211 /DNA_START=128 /DNA_END=868 /DNA_ORIENTATION=-